MKATRSRHGWVHMFITHCPTVTLRLHNFDFFRTCRTSSFCTVAWQLATFQLTWRIAQSLGDSWASFYLVTQNCYWSCYVLRAIRCIYNLHLENKCCAYAGGHKSYEIITRLTSFPFHMEHIACPAVVQIHVLHFTSCNFTSCYLVRHFCVLDVQSTRGEPTHHSSSLGYKYKQWEFYDDMTSCKNAHIIMHLNW